MHNYFDVDEGELGYGFEEFKSYIIFKIRELIDDGQHLDDAIKQAKVFFAENASEEILDEICLWARIIYSK